MAGMNGGRTNALKDRGMDDAVKDRGMDDAVKDGCGDGWLEAGEDRSRKGSMCEVIE